MLFVVLLYGACSAVSAFPCAFAVGCLMIDNWCLSCADCCLSCGCCLLSCVVCRLLLRVGCWLLVVVFLFVLWVADSRV